MKFEIQLPAIAGDAVPLFSIADAMARRDATAGGTEFHEPTFRGRRARYESMLLKHVRDGCLPTCDDDGDAGEPAAIVGQRLARGGVTVLRDAAPSPGSAPTEATGQATLTGSQDGIGVEPSRCVPRTLAPQWHATSRWPHNSTASRRVIAPRPCCATPWHRCSRRTSARCVLPRKARLAGTPKPSRRADPAQGSVQRGKPADCLNFLRHSDVYRTLLSSTCGSFHFDRASPFG
jgi:hypothetical protein